MSIRYSKNGNSVVNNVLKERLLNVAKTYYKSGVLHIGYVVHPSDIRRGYFLPDNDELPILLLRSVENNIVEMCSVFKEVAEDKAILALQAEIIRQHEAGEQTYWDTK